MFPLTPYCATCSRFDKLDFDKPSCEAYPVKIPDKIFLERFDHRKPFPGDNGIRYEKAKD